MLYYYTGEGSSFDKFLAFKLNLSVGQSVTLIDTYQVPYTKIQYFNVMPLIQPLRGDVAFKAIWFTSRALKPIILE